MYNGDKRASEYNNGTLMLRDPGASRTGTTTASGTAMGALTGACTGAVTLTLGTSATKGTATGGVSITAFSSFSSFTGVVSITVGVLASVSMYVGTVVTFCGLDGASVDDCDLVKTCLRWTTTLLTIETISTKQNIANAMTFILRVKNGCSVVSAACALLLLNSLRDSVVGSCW